MTIKTPFRGLPKTAKKRPKTERVSCFGCEQASHERWRLFAVIDAHGDGKAGKAKALREKPSEKQQADALAHRAIVY